MTARTRRFALDVILYCEALPRREAGRIIANQLMRSATSVGANYRSARLARSRAEFISRLGIVEEEADESLYWLQLLADLDAGEPERRLKLEQEAGELVAIVVATRKSARASRKSAT